MIQWFHIMCSLCSQPDPAVEHPGCGEAAHSRASSTPAKPLLTIPIGNWGGGGQGLAWGALFPNTCILITAAGSWVQTVHWPMVLLGQTKDFPANRNFCKNSLGLVFTSNPNLPCAILKSATKVLLKVLWLALSLLWSSVSCDYPNQPLIRFFLQISSQN